MMIIGPCVELIRFTDKMETCVSVYVIRYQSHNSPILAEIKMGHVYGYQGS